MLDNSLHFDTQTMVQAIYRAFDQAPIPAEADLGPDNNSGDPDLIELRRRVSGKTWPILLQEMLNMDSFNRNFFHGTHYLFMPAAFHYYLPAFMIVSADPAEADFFGEALIFALTPSDVPGSFHDKWFTAVMALVTPAQREVIRLFILSMNELCYQFQIGDATEDKALQQFWFPEGFPGHIARPDYDLETN